MKQSLLTLAIHTTMMKLLTKIHLMIGPLRTTMTISILVELEDFVDSITQDLDIMTLVL
jgi:hypothetical protein